MIPFAILAVTRPASPDPEARCVALDSAAGRRRFRVATALEREVVLVSASTDAAAGNALALALHAQATPLGDAWRIARPEALARSLREAGQRETSLAGAQGATPSFGVVERLARARQEFAARRGEGTFAGDRSIQAAELSPAARLLAGLLTTIASSTLAQAPTGATTLFSNRPVGEERPLPTDGRLVATYVANEGRYAEWAQSGRGARAIAPGDRRLFPAEGVVPGDRTLIVQVGRQGATPSFGIAVYNPEGRLESFASIVAACFAFPAPPVLPARPLGRTALSAEAAAAVAESATGAPPLRREMLDPKAHEPLDRFVREALVRYARAQGFVRVAACVPDDLHRATRACVADGRLDLDGLGRAIAAVDAEEIPSGDTLVIRPAHPLQEEATRVGRRPLVAEYRAAAAGRFDFDALIAFHRAYADAYRNSGFLYDLDQTTIRAFSLSDTPGLGLPHDLLAALGDLSKDERALLVADRTIAIGEADHPVGARALASLLSPQKAPSRTDLSRVSTRLLADPAGFTISALASTATLVRRVSRFESTVVTRNMATGEIKTETGTNLLVDPVFVPFTERRMMSGLSHLAETSAQYLDATSTTGGCGSGRSPSCPPPGTTSMRGRSSSTSLSTARRRRFPSRGFRAPIVSSIRTPEQWGGRRARRPASLAILAA